MKRAKDCQRAGLTRAGEEASIPTMMSLGRAGLKDAPGPAAARRLREEYRRGGHLRLPAFLDAGLLSAVRRSVRRAGCRELRTRVMRARLTADAFPDVQLMFLLTSPDLFAAVRALTGCGPIRYFCGRVHRWNPDSGDYLDWHSDAAYNTTRRVALTINLGGRYRGGRLQLRDRRGRQLADMANTGPGDAVIFHPGPGRWHRNTPVEGRAPKLSYIGWFYGPGGRGASAPFHPGLAHLRKPLRMRRAPDDAPPFAPR